MSRIDTNWRARYIPQDSTEIIHPGGLGVVYVYTGRLLGAIGYRGKATKAAFHFTFKTVEARAKHIHEFFRGLDQHKAIVAQNKAIQNKPHTFRVGDIVSNSWGYDQTNVDWYRVTRATDHFVWLQPICGRIESAEGYGPMAGHSAPHVDTTAADSSAWKFDDLARPEEKHRAAGESITMRHGSGSKWNGREVYVSWYA